MRVMIVDDEPKVLEHLCILLDEMPEYHLCAQAGNGDEALALLGEAQPDIIITDIRMPGMDGLQLLESISRQGYVIGCVVLSGYGDFHYTQRAMSQGIKNYILKPLVLDELRTALDGARQEVLNARQLDQQIKKGVVARREHWLTGKLYGYTRSEEEPQALEVDFSSGVLYLIAVLDNEGEEEEEMPWQNALTKLQSPDCILSVISENRVACLSALGPPEEKAAQLQQWFALRKKRTCVAYSTPIHDFAHLADHYRTLQRLLDSRWLMQGSHILCEDALPLLSENNWDELRNWDHDQLEKAICLCDQEDIRRQVHRFFTALKAASLSPETLRYFFTADIIHSMQLVLEHGGDAYQAVGSQLNLEETLRKSDVTQLETWYADLCERIALYLRHMRQDRPVNVSKQILAMFEADCAHNYTLRELAETFFMSEAYLGQLFKKEVGKTVHACLTEKRMEKAKQLLRTGDAPVYRVAEDCGYPNLRNFFTVFKKYTGCTPNEYRTKG